MAIRSREQARNEIALAVRAIVVAAVILIPIRIVGQGYLPTDDALRHAGKAVSGEEWSEILVLRADMTMDNHPGWHGILGAVHWLTDCNTHSLVLFSVVFLFIWFCAIPVLALRRPEAWLAGLLVLAVMDVAVLSRLFQGRPLLWSAAIVIAFSFFWPALEKKRTSRPILILFVALIASATCIHGAWYLYSLPVLAGLLARKWRASAKLALCWLIGVLAGALLTGHPFAFLQQVVMHAYLALGTPQPAGTLAGEFLPFSGAPLMVISIVLLLLWRALRGRWSITRVDDPVFLMAVLGWALGFVAIRFWSDWAIPALLTWMAFEFQDLFEERLPPLSNQRLILATSVTLIAFLATTADAGGRWSTVESTFAPLARKEAQPLLPDVGGILYSGEMRIFFELFYRYPKAPWRYIVGFEPGLMPPEDLEVYREILGSPRLEALMPWVRKMRPADRLIIRSLGGVPPIPQLQWQHAGGPFWSGRLPLSPN